MENQATQTGASVHDQLMERLAPPEETQDDLDTEIVEESDSLEKSEPEEVETAESSEEAQEEEVSTDAEDENTESQIELSDLAEYLGVEADKLDVDDSGAILVKTKIDGQEGVAKFSDLIKSHQLEGHLNKQNMEVVEAQKALDTQRTELESQVSAKLQETETLTQLAYGELTREFESIDWNSLRAEDPAEYAAQQRDFDARKQSITEAYQKVQQDKHEQDVKQNQELQAHLQAEDQKLYQAIEGWDKPETAKKEFSEVMSYLQTAHGYSNENLYGVRDQNGAIVQPGISDHKIVVMARKAMLYDQLQQTKPSISKKVRKAPKIAKVGAIKAVDTDAKKHAELKNKVKQSGGKTGSLAAYLLETGKV